MTLPNKITVFRILLIPLFVYTMLEFRVSGGEFLRWTALGIFAVAAALDGVDGYIARRYRLHSELGAVLDPLADKLLLVSAVIVLSLPFKHLAPIPRWFAVAILSRDVLAVMGLAVIYFTVGHVSVRPRWTGKLATVLQMVTVLWTMLRWPVQVQVVVAASAAITTLVAGLQYGWDGWRLLANSPRSSPTPRD